MCKSFVVFLVGLLFSILLLENGQAEEMQVPLKLKIDREERETSAKLIFQWHWYDKPDNIEIEPIKKKVHDATTELTSAIRENDDDLYRKLSENSWKCEELPSSGGVTLTELRAGNETFPEINKIAIARVGDLFLNYYSVESNNKNHFAIGFPFVMEGAEVRHCSQFYKTPIFGVLRSSLYSTNGPVVPESTALPSNTVIVPLMTCATQEQNQPRIEFVGGRLEDSGEYAPVLNFCVEAETLRNKSFSALSLEDDFMKPYLKVLTQASQQSISLFVAKDGLQAWNKTRNSSVMVEPRTSLVLELGDAYLVVFRVEAVAGQKKLDFRYVLKSGDDYTLANAETHMPMERFFNLEYVRDALERYIDEAPRE